jgi:paraquat-inducible protein B
MTDKKPKAQITVKRKVAVRAIVTDQFKDFLRLELKENIRMAKQRIEEIENQMKQGEKVATLIPQLLSERQQLQYTLDYEAAQHDAIDKLEGGSMFSQGTIDGFVTVSEGDNLYEKIGGMEVVVKDGVIQKINALTVPSTI